MKQVLFAALIFLFFSCNSKTENTGSEPKNELIQLQVIPGELPDPSIIEVDGIYYATGSSNDWEPLYPIYKSTDLVNWIFVNYVFDEIPEWTSSSFWAPELFYRKGKFFVYYTAKRKDGVSVIGVASSNDIESGFEDHGQLLEWGNESIDAFVLEEGDKLFVSWKAYGLNPDKPITLMGSQLSDDGLQLQGEAFEMLVADSDNWEKGGIEGQSIVEKDGFLYMLYSGNACCGAGCDYMVGLARAKSFEGPWEKFSGNPVLVGNDSWKCPGHGTAIKTGNEWFYLYHAYSTDGFPYIGRSTLLSQMFWDEETGWPYFKVSNEVSETATLKSTIKDDFSSEKLSPHWRFDIPAYQFDASLKDGKLHLTEKEIDPSNLSGTFLGLNPESADFTISTKVETGNEAWKGLAIYATRDKSMGMGVAENQLLLWKVKDGNLEELNKIEFDSQEEVLLKTEVNNGHEAKFYYSLDGQNWINVPDKLDQKEEVIGDHLDFWSWGIKAGIYVEGNGDSKTGIFDLFEIGY
ncbi:beta-xylosidase [Algoriphagus iocasae]|uniref:Beta-xylosidase n=1 Tax=Algoriphagus iocasae TaxID=1836499 RepID=A0A841MQK5_9BACT|nr:family 43 glycosylhydrolase [Algoriphagus iocasae]MBB6327879.1 beta-xylosidase [Algoriphagus iocasae]